MRIRCKVAKEEDAQEQFEASNCPSKPCALPTSGAAANPAKDAISHICQLSDQSKVGPAQANAYDV